LQFLLLPSISLYSMPEPSVPPPTDDERRRAACAAMAQAPGLVRFASRYTRSLHDAEDAYQRAMEIALVRAPVAESRRFMAWLYAVLRNEALAITQARRREGPGVEADVAEVCAEHLDEGVSVDAQAEWRERYRSIQDGLAGLTDAQRVCLMLQSAGASYERISQITGFSPRKVERSVLEGRASLQAWEIRLASGAVCAEMDAAIDRLVANRASPRERRAVLRHVRHCSPCRAILRERRESNEWLAALVPMALLAGGAVSVHPPDPSPIIAWWERVAGGATVRAGTLVQLAMDLPTSALAKVGAGTAAVAVAGAAGAPLVADALRTPTPAVAPAAMERVVSTPATAAGPAAATGSRSTMPRASFAASSRRATGATSRRRARPRRATTTVSLPTRPDPPPTTARRTAPAVSAAAHPAPAPAPVTVPPAAPSASAVALEFGP
jgi:RNA polymerase sigma factor (sigma-70 family)